METVRSNKGHGPRRPALEDSDWEGSNSGDEEEDVQATARYHAAQSKEISQRGTLRTARVAQLQPVSHSTEVPQDSTQKLIGMLVHRVVGMPAKRICGDEGQLRQLEAASRQGAWELLLQDRNKRQVEMRRQFEFKPPSGSKPFAT
eukprot:GHVU01234680.1.p1 GENE.GHVU01234680.1~~GHVU01234680.1.p1  ORF type:complete len:146 (+),score=13.37 GHVU01234680.1:61-498(+)